MHQSLMPRCVHCCMVLQQVFNEALGNSQVVILPNYILSLALIKASVAYGDSAIVSDYQSETDYLHVSQTEGLFPVVHSDMLVEWDVKCSFWKHMSMSESTGKSTHGAVT